MRSYLAVAISIWVILEPSLAEELSLDLKTATETSYSNLLKDVRDNVKDPKLKYGGTNVPVIAAPTNPIKHLLVDLKASDGGVITIALRKENLYLDGYLNNVNGNPTAKIFKDVPKEARKNLFPHASHDELKYGGSYKDIMSNAFGEKSEDRIKKGLGVNQLNKFINSVYGKNPVVKEEAQLMLIIVQTIAEAARFKYIENLVLGCFHYFECPSNKIAIELEKSWQKITNAIKGSKNGVILQKLQLTDANGKACEVSQVDYIAKHMGILKYEGKTLFEPLQSLLSTELPFIRLFGFNGFYGNDGIHNLRTPECSW